ncbi:hypothetical protein KSP39_PZI006044 [Platanthera zijinensis]|uniref:Uncharacterized protein n=1 Tax=Platanthera zijinensis TaxID=2320716 RepID=A0AAP0BU64_9ASPA
MSIKFGMTLFPWTLVMSYLVVLDFTTTMLLISVALTLMNLNLKINASPCAPPHLGTLKLRTRSSPRSNNHSP